MINCGVYIYSIGRQKHIQTTTVHSSYVIHPVGTSTFTSILPRSEVGKSIEKRNSVDTDFDSKIMR